MTTAAQVNNAAAVSAKPAAVRASNMEAARAVSDAVRTSLGPRGMDKMIRTAGGETLVTNDGATILRHMAVLHPCARMLVELSEAQDAAAGDGTTSVVVLAGALLGAAQGLLERGVHPSQLVDALRAAAAEADAALEAMATPVSLDDRDALAALAATSLASKVVGAYSSVVASAAVDAVLRVMDATLPEPVDLSRVRVVGRLGGTIEDCGLAAGGDGVVLRQRRVASGTPSRVEKPRVALVQFCLSPPKTDMEGAVVIGDYAQMDRVLAEERAHVLALCKRVKKAGITVLLVQKSILRDAVSELALQFLGKLRVAVVTDVERDEVPFLCAALGCSPIADAESLCDEARLGAADLFEEVSADDGASYLQFSGLRPDAAGRRPRVVSVLVRGATQLVVDEAERALHDALCVLRALAKRPAVLPGGGAPEVGCAVALSRAADREASGARGLALRAFGDALLAVPAILAENAGLSAVAVVTELRALHAAGSSAAGVSARRMGVADMRAEGVVQPLLVTASAVALAAETVCMILKIDDIVACR